MFVLLTAGKIFGIAGVILGIPFYAVAKVIAIHVFEWYKGVSNLYEDEEKILSTSNRQDFCVSKHGFAKIEQPMLWLFL